MKIFNSPKVKFSLKFWGFAFFFYLLTPQFVSEDFCSFRLHFAIARATHWLLPRIFHQFFPSQLYAFIQIELFLKSNLGDVFPWLWAIVTDRWSWVFKSDVKCLKFKLSPFCSAYERFYNCFYYCYWLFLSKFQLLSLIFSPSKCYFQAIPNERVSSSNMISWLL